MAILTYPLNGIQYRAEDAEAYLCTRESGVYSAENNFALEITGAMQVTIGKGIAWIKNEDFAGKVIKNDSDVTIAIPIADGTFNRIDRIVIQFDKALNATNIVLKQGTTANFPVAPAIVRNDIIYELGLYEISVNAGVVEITNENIKNTMLDETVCGLMRDGVTGIPTETLQRQAEGIIDQIRKVLENAVGENILPHAFTHSIGAEDELLPDEIGAVSFNEQILSTEQKKIARENIDAIGKTTVMLNGDIDVRIEDEIEYIFNSVTSLRIIGTINNAHGFIGFSSATPSISISGFNGMSGDDITSAIANEIWEFSCDDGFVIWKNWTNATVGTSANGTVIEDGGYYVPSIDDNGNLSWSASKPNMILPEMVNIKGESGVGIEDIVTETTPEDGGINNIEITLTDGRTFGWGIANGAKGTDGKNGAPGLVWQGEWNAETSYSAIKDGQVSRDVVSYNGSSYVVAVNNTAPVKGVIPEGDTTGKWALLAEKGDAPKTPTEVDLSGFESEGIIVETYADGSTLTHNFEFDADGKPIKIMDSDGNEMILIW